MTIKDFKGKYRDHIAVNKQKSCFNVEMIQFPNQGQLKAQGIILIKYKIFAFLARLLRG